MYNPLYNEVYKFVRDTLESRAKAYRQENSDSEDSFKTVNNDLKWSHGKMAHAYVESLCDATSKETGKVLSRMGHIKEQYGGYGVDSSISDDQTLYRTSNVINDEVEKNSLSRFIIEPKMKKAFIKSYADNDSRYGMGNIPGIPALQSVSVTNEGKMGSLQKASFNFTVSDPVVFDIYEELYMRPGREIRIRYGWNVSADPDNDDINCADSAVFRGIVYNSNWNINSNMGYDCNVDVVGEGFFTINADANATFPDGEEVSDPKASIKIMDLESQIKADISQINATTDGWYEGVGATSDDRLQYYRKEVRTSQAQAANGGGSSTPTNSSAAANINVKAGASETKYYLTINQISQYFSKKIIEQVAEESTYESNDKLVKIGNRLLEYKTDLELQWDGNCTDPDVNCKTIKENNKEILNNPRKASKDYPISAGPYVKNLRSADPSEIIFPSKENADYIEDSFFPVEMNGIKSRFEKNQKDEDYICNENSSCKLVNLGEILISVDLIIEIYNQLKDKQDSPLQQTIGTFFERIFNRISLHSGGIYQLSFITKEFYMDPNNATSDEDAKKIRVSNIIVDTNWNGCSSVDPYIFTPRFHHSLMHEFNMSSKLPNATQTAMYAGGRTKISQNVGSKDAFSSLQNRYFESCGLPEEPDEDTNESGEEVNWDERLKIIIGLIGQNGINEVYRGELQTLMKRLKAYPDEFSGEDNVTKMAGSWIGKTTYPLEFSVTLDGISGFRFGNVVSSDWIPTKYQYKPEGATDPTLISVFVVTKVSHKIEGFKWTTTLETQNRFGREE